MTARDPELPEIDWTKEELDAISTGVSKASPYLFRLARAIAYGMAAFLFLWLQPHFTFSYFALALGVFFLATVRRTTWAAEIVLCGIVVSAFLPHELLRAIAKLF